MNERNPAQENDIHLVYVTFPNQMEAIEAARTVVQQRLAAGANIVPALASVYWWHDELQEHEESAVMFQTQGSRVEALSRRIKQLHSYECPCVVSWPLSLGNAGFFQWVREQTR